MGNPYPVELRQGVAVTEAGALTFTDPANQPGPPPITIVFITGFNWQGYFGSGHLT